MLEKEFIYYIENQTELVNMYNGKFIVIIENNVINAFDTFEEALSESQKKYTLGTFLIQECFEGKKSYTQKFHSRVIFN